MAKHGNKNKAVAQQQQQQQQQQQAPAEIAQVPGFFGHAVKPGQALKWANEVEEFALNLNSAALGTEVKEGRSTLFVNVKGAKVALCTLAPQSAEQWNLTQTFAPLDGEVEFLVEGANAVHLTGFIDVQEEEDSGDEHDFDDDDHELDEEEEEIDPDDMMVFEAGGSSDEEAESEEEEEEEEEEDAEGRFEVIEERVHVHKDEAKPAKKIDVKKEVKKEAKSPAKASPAKEQPKKQEQKKPEQPKKQEQKQVEKKEQKPAAKKEKAAAEAKKMKQQAEKIAELTANVGKKRPAPSDAVDVPKKAKTSRPYKGITIEELAVGKGAGVQKGRKVSILYRGRLENGKQFDAAQNRKKPFTFRHGIGDVIKGMDIGLEGMRAGGKRTIHIPAKLGYGRSGAPPTIPPNANLIFDIELL